jgi:hypothetical protein
VCDVEAVADHPVAEAAGAVAVSVIIYPVTAMLSVAVKRVIGILSEVAVAGIVNPVTVGAVVSMVMVTEALRLVDTLPAASLAQA